MVEGFVDKRRWCLSLSLPMKEEVEKIASLSQTINPKKRKKEGVPFVFLPTVRNNHPFPFSFRVIIRVKGLPDEEENGSHSLYYIFSFRTEEKGKTKRQRANIPVRPSQTTGRKEGKKRNPEKKSSHAGDLVKCLKN